MRTQSRTDTDTKDIDTEQNRKAIEKVEESHTCAFGTTPVQRGIEIKIQTEGQTAVVVQSEWKEETFRHRLRKMWYQFLQSHRP